MFADRCGVKEWTRLEEAKMCCSEEGLNWGAEERLVHVLDPVLYVCDCVDVVCVMRYVSGGWSNAGSVGLSTGCGGVWSGCDG